MGQRKIITAEIRKNIELVDDETRMKLHELGVYVANIKLSFD